MQNSGFSLPTSGIQGITSGITSKIGRLDETSSVSDAPTAEQAKGFQSLLADAIGSVNEGAIVVIDVATGQQTELEVMED